MHAAPRPPGSWKRWSGVNSCGAFCSFCGKCGRNAGKELKLHAPPNVPPPGVSAEAANKEPERFEDGISRTHGEGSPCHSGKDGSL